MSERRDPSAPAAPGVGADPAGPTTRGLSRRSLLRVGAAGAVGAAGVAVAGAARAVQEGANPEQLRGAAQLLSSHGHVGSNDAVGDISPGGFDPTAYLTEYDYGRVSTTADGRTLREWDIVAVDREIEVAPGIWFPAWTYNGQVPGPTLRCTEGDRLRVYFRNAGTHPHTIHFHGTHPAAADGVFEIVDPGASYVYEFDAEPFGLHLYHCHAIPLKRHIHKGLYGTFIIDPPGGREPARELVMMMNGFDTNFDGSNEIYAVNTVGFHYQRHPIRLALNELVRVYLVNITEFDLINSLHLHGNMFRLYRTGTDLERHELTDTVTLCQGERAVLEFRFKFPGRFMFHAHQSEFAELGWMAMFDVRGEEAPVV
jgi:FtsP/CotA-like multicopper oxidase with cupredoxin domain